MSSPVPPRVGREFIELSSSDDEEEHDAGGGHLTAAGVTDITHPLHSEPDRDDIEMDLQPLSDADSSPAASPPNNNTHAVSASPAASAAAAAAAAGATVQSRSGRRVLKPQVYAPGESTVKKDENHSKGGGGGGGGGSSSKSADRKKKKPSRSEKHAAAAAAASADLGYHGQGFTVRDHAWFVSQGEVTYASPPIPQLETLYVQVSCEEACRQAGIEMTRQMRVQLSEATLASLHHCIGGDHERGEIDRTVLSLCDNGDTRACALFQSEKGTAESIRVVSTRFIKDGECLCVYMGTLREVDSVPESSMGRGVSRNGDAFYEISREVLPADYTGKNLILETNTHGNEARFFRDARWDELEISPNVECRVGWNHAMGLPFLALVALADIEKHRELFVDWGEDAWSLHARSHLHRSAHKSWRMHERMLQIQRELARRGVEPYASHKTVPIEADIPFEEWHNKPVALPPVAAAPAAASSAAPSSVAAGSPAVIAGSDADGAAASAAAAVTPMDTSEDDTGAAAPRDCGQNNNEPAAAAAPAASTTTTATAVGAAASSAAVPAAASSSSAPLLALHTSRRSRKQAHRPMRRTLPQHPAPTFVLRNTRAVFENCGVPQLTACDYSLLDADVRAALKSVAAVTPPPRLSNSLRASLQAVLETGRSPKAAVYEVLSTKHPARFYSPPDSACYALLARETIQAREPIGVYVGRVHNAEMFHEQYGEEDRIKQVYAYSMSKELFAASYTGPALVCESLSGGGNEMRFVNDVWCRRGGERCKNADASLYFDTARIDQNGQPMPVMVICANRVINKGEEILTDYGTGFWNKISTALAREHKNFQEKIEPQLTEMETKLAKMMLVEANPQEAASTAAAASSAATAVATAPSPDSASAAAVANGADSAAASASVESSLSADVRAAVLPPLPDRWACYRSLYNQHDAMYAHTRPVRLDPVRHADSFPHDTFVAAEQAVQAALQKEQERAAREAKRQAAAQAREEAARAAAEREAAAAQGRRTGRLRKAPAKKNDDVTPALEAQRRSSRGIQAAAAAATVASPALVASSSGDSVMEIEPAAAGTAGATAASAEPVSSSFASPDAAVAASSTTDDEVQVLSPPPNADSVASAPSSVRKKPNRWAGIPAHNFISVSSATPTHVCDDCGEPCIPRAFGEKTFIKCRSCFKQRVANDLHNVSARSSSSGGKPTRRKSASVAAAAAAIPTSDGAAAAAPPAAPVQAAAAPHSAPDVRVHPSSLPLPALPSVASAAPGAVSAASSLLPLKRAHAPVDDTVEHGISEQKEGPAPSLLSSSSSSSDELLLPSSKRARHEAAAAQQPPPPLPPADAGGACAAALPPGEMPDLPAAICT